MANEGGALMAWCVLTPGGVWYNKTAYRLMGCIGMAVSTEANAHGGKIRQHIRTGNIWGDLYEL